MTHRTFVDEMDNDRDGFFTPNRDFNVVSGDSSNGRATMADILSRTPASEKDLSKTRESAALSNELRSLEDSQNTEQYYHYLEYKDKLTSISEKIYYLRLKSIQDRNDYLYSKGHYQISSPNNPEINEAIGNREIVVGMRKDDVMASWGRPSRVDVAGNPSLENERWTFFYRGRLKQVYFENGQVQGWDIDQ
jgi:hypothetical protein